MPSCFQLTRKGDTEPSNLQHIDRCICQALDIPFSEDQWAGGWYNSIGLLLAVGKTFDEILDMQLSNHRIVAYLAEHYTSDSWHQWK